MSNIGEILVSNRTSWIPLAVTIATLVGYGLWGKKEVKATRSRVPLKVTLTSINVFPIKSCGFLTVKSWKVGKSGLENDRKWMVVTTDGLKAITQRQNPKLSLIQPSFEDGFLVLNAPNQPTFKIPMEGKDRKVEPMVQVYLWKQYFRAVDEGNDVAQWLSNFLGSEVRLVRSPDDNDRSAPPQELETGEKSFVSFGDDFPFLLASEESLQDLNSKLEKPLPMLRFRPNLVVKASQGGYPFMEDDWRKIIIGGVTYKISKPCARCKVTTVDFNKGEYDGEEPLKTLRTYRSGLLGMRKDDILFAQNAIHLGPGEVHVGHSVQILS